MVRNWLSNTNLESPYCHHQLVQNKQKTEHCISTKNSIKSSGQSSKRAHGRGHSRHIYIYIYIYGPPLYIGLRYNIKLNSTFNFRFYMYGIFLKRDLTC